MRGSAARRPRGRRAAFVATSALAGLGFAAATVQAAPTWLPTETLSTQAPSSVDGVTAALSANGDTAVLYTRGTPDAGSNATSAQAELALRPLGGGWQPPQSFTPTNAAASATTLSIDDEGRAFGLWSGGTGNLGLFGIDREAGAVRFGSPVALHGGGYAISNSPIPTSAANRAGRTVAAWIEGSNLTVRRIVVRVRDAGAPEFGPAQRLTRDTDGSVDEWGEPESGAKPDGPRVAVAPDGTVYVAWSQSDGKTHSGSRAYYATQAPGASTFSAPKLITAVPTTTSASEPVRGIAVGADGTVAVSLGGPSSLLAVARLAPNASAFEAPVQINSGLGVGFGSQSNGAAVAVDGQGRISAAFDPGTTTVAGRLYVTQQATAGGAFSTPEALPATAQSYPRGAAIAVQADGDAVVAWAEAPINAVPTRVARVQTVTRDGATGSFSAPRTLDERQYIGTAVVPVSTPRVTVAPNGDAAVSWGWNTADTGAWEARLAALDVEGPVVADGTASATAGTAVTLTADAQDRFSDVATVEWTFGDGSTGTGDRVSHVYAAAGTYEAKATATDAHGNARTATHTVTVAAAPVVPDPVDPVPPVVPTPPVLPLPAAPTPTVVTPPSTPAPNPTPSPAAKVSGVTLRGRTVRLRTTKAGKLRVVVQRRTVKRVRKNGRVVNRVSYRQVQRLTVTAKRSGATSFRVRKLAAGRYRIRVTPTTGRGAKTTSTSVRVVR
ncbi:MAG: PKD domain-containing protein [Patulibacter sp.]